jgi:hypothetical protein
MRNKLLLACLQSAALTAALVTGAAAQSAQGGWTCRGAMSADATGKQIGFVWVRLNPGDTAEVWRAPGSAMPPDSIPTTPPASAQHQDSGHVSRFGGNVVGVSYLSAMRASVMFMVDVQNHTLSTSRQKVPIACTP